MTAKLLQSKRTQAERIIEHIRKHPGCGNRDLFQYSNAPWARLYERTYSDGHMHDGTWDQQNGWRLDRSYIMRNGRRQVTYYIRKV